MYLQLSRCPCLAALTRYLKLGGSWHIESHQVQQQGQELPNYSRDPGGSCLNTQRGGHEVELLQALGRTSKAPICPHLPEGHHEACACLVSHHECPQPLCGRHHGPGHGARQPSSQQPLQGLLRRGHTQPAGALTPSKCEIFPQLRQAGCQGSPSDALAYCFRLGFVTVLVQAGRCLIASLTCFWSEGQ